MKISSFYLSVLLLLICHNGWANTQEDFMDFLSGSQIVNNATLTIEDRHYQCRQPANNNCPLDFILIDTRLYAQLSFKDNRQYYYQNDWKVTVEYQIEQLDYQGNLKRNDGQLTVEYHPTKPYQDIDLLVCQPAFNQNFLTKAELKVTNITITDRNDNRIINPFGSDLTDDIRLELHLETERVYEFKVNQQPNIINTGIYLPNTQELRLEWDKLPGAVEYDLEWLFVDMTNKSPSQSFEINFRNATRITTTKDYYQFSLAYPQGYLIYRVRGIGSGNVDPINNPSRQRWEGKWSFANEGTFVRNTSGTLTALNATANVACEDFYFWNGLEPEKNWQYNVVYAEEGKRKEVINFYDDILKPQQTATIINTDETVVVSEPVYDFVGRNSLQVLPAPQRNQGIRYYPPPHLNTGGDVYDYEDFDFDTNISRPTPLSPNGNLGAGHYYSNQNTTPLGIHHEYIPNAEGYPYSRTIYKNDGSGRVKAMSGIGKEYFGGNGNSIQHDTRFLYSSPFQEELFMLFGNEAGYAKYYEKTTVVDANGQASVSIKDLAGRVVATALVGDAPANLQDLDSKPDQYRPLTVQLTPLNQRIDDELTVNKMFTVVGTTTYNFNYKLDPAIFSNCGTRVNCVYDLLIYVADEYGNRQSINWNGDQVSEIEITKIRNELANSPITFSTTLTTGSYQLVKILRLNEAAVEQAVADWEEEQNCYEARTIDPITTCTPDCATLCQDSYITPPDSSGRRYYLSIVAGDRIAEVDADGQVIQIYNQTALNQVQDSIAACRLRCEQIEPTESLFSECDIKYELLKQDMSPGGQYFDNLPDRFLPGDTILNTTYDRNGWLENVAIGHPDYSRFIACVGESFDNQWDRLRTNWRPEFADILVTLHPEWCAFETLCCAEVACNSPDDPAAGISLTYADSCVTLTADIEQQINDQLAVINFDSLSQVAISQVTDTALHPEFSADKIRERAIKFYREYYKHDLVKNKCTGLYLDSPDDDLRTADGFMIRYPKNPVFEVFNPNNPTGTDPVFGNEICEEQANIQADGFIQQLENKCGDVLTVAQRDDLRQYIYDWTLTDCYDSSGQMDLNAAISDYIRSNTDISTACYLSALPVQSDTLCACEKINGFAHDVLRQNEPNLTLPDLVNYRRYANHPDIQAALDIVLDPAETGLKRYFTQWMDNCNEPLYLNWMGAATSTPYQLPGYFRCDALAASPPCDTCCAETLNTFAQAIADLEFERLLAVKAFEYRSALIDSCLNSAFLASDPSLARETFTMTYDYKAYHYTLYYYTQAGNLVKNVPSIGIYQKDLKNQRPGVDYLHNSLLTDIEIQAAYDWQNGVPGSRFQHTRHLLITNYQYNSLDNVTTQHTPDGDDITFFYDALGRRVVSQNAVQRAYTVPRYSYLAYDSLGRTIEAGELESSDPMTKNIAEDITDYNLPVNPSGTNALLNWLATHPKKEATYSFYDQLAVAPSHPIHGQQQHLRNRISTTAYDEDGDLQYEALTHYSYDVQGNVETLWQEHRHPDLPPEQQIKRLDYEYDLVSGNVNQVHYQRGAMDQLSHRYEYDGDNRLQKAWTSTNEIVWEQEAKYDYYAHGPLARIEIGDRQVQAQDYAYTLQGWLKTVNSSTGVAERDLGKDGMPNTLNANFARDAYGFSLHYFDSDYQPINNRYQPIANTDNITAPALYNGNISKMLTALSDVNEVKQSVLGRGYDYDVKNRIYSAKLWKDDLGKSVLQNNTFAGTTNNDDYETTYSYDGNGNIMTLNRNGQGANQAMDRFSYQYQDLGTRGEKLSNRLDHVKDVIDPSHYANDLDNQAAGNYTYDNIGRLIADTSEEIQEIKWNVTNKVTEIIRTPGSNRARLKFHYSPSGDRIAKTVIRPTGTSTTFYVRDAQGNVMTTYQQAGSNTNLQLQEQHLYGSARIGVRNYRDFAVREYAEAATFSFENNEPNPFDDNRHLNFLITDPAISHWGDNCMLLQFPTAEWGPRIKQKVSYGDSITTTIYGKTPSGGSSAILVKTVTDGVDNVLYLDANRTNAAWDARGSFGTDWSKNGFERWQVTAPYYKADGTLADPDDLYLFIYPWAPNNSASTYFDDFYYINHNRSAQEIKRELGHKQYELTNHLGNVLQTIADRKLAQFTPVIEEDFNGVGDLGGFISDSGSTITLSNSTGDQLKVTTGAAIWTGPYLQWNTIVGETYTVQFDFININAPFYLVGQVLDGNWNSFQLVDLPSDGTYTLTFTATTTTSIFRVYKEGQTTDVSYYLDNVQILTDGHYLADVQSQQAYYPFGMLMPGRNGGTGEGYRYGFQGQESEGEISEEKDSYSFFKYRISDNRIGRFFAVDPLASKYPYNSTYAFSENRVIDGVELEGLEFVKFLDSKVIDISKMTDKKLEKLIEVSYKYHQGHLTVSELKGMRKSKEFWYIYSPTNTYGKSLRTVYEKFASKQSWKKGKGKYYDIEIKKDISQYLYSWDEKLEGKENVWNGVTLMLATWAAIGGGISLIAAIESGSVGAILFEGGSLVISIDDMTNDFEGGTISDKLIGSTAESFGVDKETAKKYLSGFKLAYSFANKTKGLMDVTVSSSNGDKIQFSYDVQNALFTNFLFGKDLNNFVLKNKKQEEEATTNE